VRSTILVGDCALNSESCQNPILGLLLHILGIARSSIIKLHFDIVLHEPRPTLNPLQPYIGWKIAYYTLVVHHRDLVILVELIQLVRHV
jgi:hypothetical protein